MTRINIHVEGGLVTVVSCTKPARVKVIDHDAREVGERAQSRFMASRLKTRKAKQP